MGDIQIKEKISTRQQVRRDLRLTLAGHARDDRRLPRPLRRPRPPAVADVLQELRGIVPDLPSVPVQPLILTPQEEPGMFDFFRGFRSVLDVHRYDTPDRLIADLGERVINPAEAKAKELRTTGC